ncbi:MAG: FAD binding domain-containing protein [Firmicutes bacterium]|nr:FAD binding domain-containing protein [Bacillota bacterium]
MALPEFDYVAAKSLEEASKLASEKGDKCIFMAGGTDVILKIRDRKLKDVDTVIDIKNIPDMDQIEFIEGEGLKVGALVKLYDIQNSDVVKKNIPALAKAAHYVASAQIRRKGTMVGNICNASASADTAGILLSMNAKINTYSTDGGRQIAIDDFFVGAGKTCLDKSKGEIVTSVLIPELKSGQGSGYFKHSVRKAMDIAIVGLAAWVKLDGKKIEDCRLSMASVGPTTMRALEAEKILIGQEFSEDIIEKAGQAAAKECKARSGVRAGEDYKRDMIRVYTKRALREAVETVKA